MSFYILLFSIQSATVCLHALKQNILKWKLLHCANKLVVAVTFAVSFLRHPLTWLHSVALHRQVPEHKTPKPGNGHCEEQFMPKNPGKQTTIAKTYPRF